MVMVDCIARLIPDVLAEGSAANESFAENLLEYPQYTRPQEFMGLKVPEVLVSGDHGKVDAWRRKQSEELTRKLRPDLIE